MTAKAQIVSPAAETEGYKAPGGGLRASIRDRIAAVSPYTSKIVSIPQWDAQIEVRSMSLGERNDMMTKADGELEMSSLYPEIVIRCAYDPETGEKVFSEDDVAFVNSLPADLVDKIALPALELSGMTNESVDEEAKKSSPAEAGE